MIELNKEKKQHKIDYHTTNMFPSSGAAPNEETWAKEMSEGIKELNPNEEDDNNEDKDDESPETVDDSKSNKLKTMKQRRKALKLLMKEKRKNYDKREKMRILDVYKIKTLTKEIKAEEEQIAQNMAKRKEQKETKKNMPAAITGHKYEEQDIDLKVSNFKGKSGESGGMSIYTRSTSINFYIIIILIYLIAKRGIYWKPKVIETRRKLADRSL